jgi:outer membrane lipoprotein-sorting protein
MNRWKIFAVAGLLAGAALCIAWADSWDGIRSAAEGVTSVHSEFVQKKYLPILSKPLVSSGFFSYQRPGSLRWEYSTPIHSILLMHNGRVRRFIQEGQGFREESSAGLEAMQVVLEQITQWLSGRFDDNGMFTATLEQGPKIVLKPKSEAMGSVLDRIELYLDTRPGTLKQVLIYEGPKSYTELTFSDTVLNQPMDAAVFQNQP